jgi:hypothetical protein
MILNRHGGCSIARYSLHAGLARYAEMVQTMRFVFRFTVSETVSNSGKTVTKNCQPLRPIVIEPPTKSCILTANESAMPADSGLRFCRSERVAFPLVVG